MLPRLGLNLMSVAGATISWSVIAKRGIRRAAAFRRIQPTAAARAVKTPVSVAVPENPVLLCLRELRRNPFAASGWMVIVH